MLLKEVVNSRAGEGRYLKTLEHLSGGGAKKEESAKQKEWGQPVRTPNVQNCNNLNNSNTKNKINMHECTVLQINRRRKRNNSFLLKNINNKYRRNGGNE